MSATRFAEGPGACNGVDVIGDVDVAIWGA